MGNKHIQNGVIQEGFFDAWTLLLSSFLASHDPNGFSSTATPTKYSAYHIGKMVSTQANSGLATRWPYQLNQLFPFIMQETCFL